VHDPVHRKVPPFLFLLDLNDDVLLYSLISNVDRRNPLEEPGGELIIVQDEEEEEDDVIEDNDELSFRDLLLIQQ
jgi:hypothetical protein